MSFFLAPKQLTFIPSGAILVYSITTMRFIMKQSILVTAVLATVFQLTGCGTASGPSVSSNGAGIDPGTSAVTPIADQRLAVSEFKKDGVKIIYSLTGNIEAIEVTGYAPSWGGSHNAAREAFRAAELEAKKSLNDFIHRETISSKTSVVMISENLEHAQDNTNNKFATNKAGNQNGNSGTADDLVAVDEEVNKQVADGTIDSKENTAIRNNALKIASKLRTTIVTSNRGILSGLYLKEGSVIDDGKAVKVVMRWDKKNNAGRIEIGRLMAM